MKTTKDWLETLPEPYRTQALDNAKREGSEDDENYSLHEAMLSAFIWEDSPEGHPYWKSVEGRARSGKFDSAKTI